MDMRNLSTQEIFEQTLTFFGVQGQTVALSALGHKIVLLSRRGAGARLLVIGGVHAREEITVPLCVALFAGYDGPWAVDCLPLLNPDGTYLAAGGPLPQDAEARGRLLALNHGSTDFSMWKANARGVDLNVNFDAGWGSGRTNRFVPGPADYVGPAPFSEVETRLVRRLMHTRPYDCVLCYHARGQVVYHGFGNALHPTAAHALADHVGYRVATTPHSAGGAKDYWVAQTGRPGLTIEVTDDAHPYHSLQGFDALVRRHRGSWQALEGALGGQ